MNTRYIIYPEDIKDEIEKTKSHIKSLAGSLPNDGNPSRYTVSIRPEDLINGSKVYPSSLSFGKVGRLSWNDGKLTFEGNLEESAKVFMEYLCDIFNDHIKNLIQEKADKLDTQKNDFLREHLKLWKDSGIPAPMNELQSIDTWLTQLTNSGEEKTKDIMRKRIILLMEAVAKLHKEGPEAEEAAGIYDNRPDMRPKNEF